MIGFARSVNLVPNNDLRRSDDQGQPLTPSLELKQIENFFGQLFQDPSFQYSGNVPLQTLPFTSDDVLRELQHLPEMKVICFFLHARHHLS